MKNDLTRSMLLGLAVGDALGVPVEFMSRAAIARDPVTGMRGFGTHRQPAGTFSDDSSMTFCLAECLTGGGWNKQPDLQELANRFVNWRDHAYWTAHGKVFDVGNATNNAIGRLRSGTDPVFAGSAAENQNGNGSLMRILPLLGYITDRPIAERYEITRQVSSLTHGHFWSIASCFYYLEFARCIVQGKDKFDAYRHCQHETAEFLRTATPSEDQLNVMTRLLQQDISKAREEEIRSSGFVIDTLEASIWCILTAENYSHATLKAVNLGEDTDTTGAVTGGLAGLVYGLNSIPPQWISQLARRPDIEELADRLSKNFS